MKNRLDIGRIDTQIFHLRKDAETLIKRLTMNFPKDWPVIICIAPCAVSSDQQHGEVYEKSIAILKEYDVDCEINSINEDGCFDIPGNKADEIIERLITQGIDVTLV